MKNFRRLDYSPLTVYTDSFCQAFSCNTHQHEDILSYVIYMRAMPVLIDSGRASYAVKDRYLDSSFHCGFSDPRWPVRPKPRFFFCREMMQETLDEHIATDSASFSCHNPLLGMTKRLAFAFRPEQHSLLVTEQLETAHSGVSGTLFHIFADTHIEQISANEIRHTSTGARLTYQNTVSLRIEETERAVDYGKTIPCRRAIIIPENGENKVAWSMIYGR